MDLDPASITNPYYHDTGTRYSDDIFFVYIDLDGERERDPDIYIYTFTR
jgi:hypothetical protein